MNNFTRKLKRDFNQWTLFTVSICFLISIPILSIAFYLFKGTGEMWSHIVNHFLFDYLKNSFILITLTGGITFIFGVSSAWIITHYNLKFNKYLRWIHLLPLTIPSYIVAYTYVGMFDNDGLFIRLLNFLGFSLKKIDFMNIYGLIWILSCSLYPYVYTSCLAMFESIPKSFKESSELLGVSKTKYFFKIVLPLAKPAIIGGLFLVSMEVLNDYGAAKYFGVQTFTTGIFRTWTMLEDLQSSIYLSALLVTIIFIINTAVKWKKKGKSYNLKNQTTPGTKTLKSYSFKTKTLCYIILFIPIVFGFIIPLSQLIYWAVLTFKNIFTIELLQVATESLTTALITTFFIMLSALFLIYSSKWNIIKKLNILTNLSTIGYVIPGAIIGIGVIRSSESIIIFFDNYLSMKVGVLFFGSIFILVYAYVFRFLAVAYNPLEANSLKLGKNMAESSYLLKKGKIKTLLNIELPILKPIILSTSLLVVIDILKELPLTLILKPYKLKTLAVRAYEYAEDERAAEAAIPALLLIGMICMLMFIINLINKRISK